MENGQTIKISISNLEITIEGAATNSAAQITSVLRQSLIDAVREAEDSVIKTF